MGETLGFGGIFAYICSKHLHTSYSNLFPCFSYGDAGFKNKCAFLVRNCCGSKMYHYSMISKVRKPFLATPPKAGLGLFLLLCGLTPNAAWLVWAATSYPSKTFHIWLLLHLPQSGIAAHLSPQETDDFSPSFYLLSHKTWQARAPSQQASSRLVSGKFPLCPW